MAEDDVSRAAALASELRPILSKLKRSLREQGPGHDLRPSQAAVILRLEKDGPAAVSALARAEGMRPQSMSTIIKTLQKAGWVKGVADPKDGRQTLMSLTKACRTWIRDGRAAREDWMTHAIQSKLSIADQKQLKAALHLLSRLVEE